MSALAPSDFAPAATAAAALNLVEIDWSTEARYLDQAWEIEVPLRHGALDDDASVTALVDDFHRLHRDIFAVDDPGAVIEAVSWNAEVRCRIGSGVPGRLAPDDRPARLPSRPVRFTGMEDRCEADVYRLEAIPEGARIVGPAIVESDFTSIVLDPGAAAWRDAAGNLVIDVFA